MMEEFDLNTGWRSSGALLPPRSGLGVWLQWNRLAQMTPLHKPHGCCALGQEHVSVSSLGQSLFSSRGAPCHPDSSCSLPGSRFRRVDLWDLLP